jgi:hypothetical protein
MLQIPQAQRSNHEIDHGSESFLEQSVPIDQVAEYHEYQDSVTSEQFQFGNANHSTQSQLKDPFAHFQSVLLSRSPSGQIPPQIELDQPDASRLNDNQICLTVSEIIIDWSNENIRELLKDTVQVFVSMNFLGLAPELLETPSMLLKETEIVRVDFKQGILRIM